MGSNPALAPRRYFGQVIHLQLPVALRQVNSDTVSIVVVRTVACRRGCGGRPGPGHPAVGHPRGHYNKKYCVND